MADIGITDIRKLAATVKDVFGCDFSNYAHSSFMRRINYLIEKRNLHSVDALIQKIENGSLTKDQFLNDITVNVTEMFRDPGFWRALKNCIVEQAKKEKLWIWHAGCSSGEEVFSMLILLNELGILDRCSLVASDFDECILGMAKNARIPLRHMELNSSNYKKMKEQNSDLMKYFRVEEEYAVFDKSLLNKVRFQNIDLTTAASFGKFNLILCRNVLIYFNQTLQRTVLRLFHDSLFMNGCLALGVKENILWSDIKDKFTVLNNEEKIYRKSKD